MIPHHRNCLLHKRSPSHCPIKDHILLLIHCQKQKGFWGHPSLHFGCQPRELIASSSIDRRPTFQECLRYSCISVMMISMLPLGRAGSAGDKILPKVIPLIESMKLLVKFLSSLANLLNSKTSMQQYITTRFAAETCLQKRGAHLLLQAYSLLLWWSTHACAC